MKLLFSLLLSAITLSILGLCCAAPAQSSPPRKAVPKTFTWSNPIYVSGNGPQDTLRDPAIIKDNNIYYIVYTMWPFRNYTDRNPKLPDLGSSPGIALYASHDLKTWTFKKWLLKSSDLPDDCLYKHQFWAPEIHKINGRYFIIFGGSNWIADQYNIGGHMGYYQFVGVADKVTGPYTHFTALKGPGVDTSLFQDDDGKTYAVWPRNEIHSIDLSKIDQDIVTVGPKLSQAATDDDFKAIGKPAPNTIEGPYLIKRRGTYYCFFAETYRGANEFYDTGVATAQSLSGPWTLDPRWRIFPGGHQALFRGPDGRFWTSYKHEESDIAPWLSIDPVDFDAEGRVHVTPTQGPQSISLERSAQSKH
jgi:xylan 1,4-beta-xylosidase